MSFKVPFLLLFLLYSLTTTNTALRIRRFPGRYQNRVHGYDYGPVNLKSLSLESRMKVEECEYGICEDADGYPGDAILNLVEAHPVLRTYFGNVVEPSVIISNRHSDSDDYESFCSNRDVSRMPRLMTDVNNIKRYIANKLTLSDSSSLEQVVKFQTCQMDKTAFCYSANYPDDYVAKCEQKYTNILLLAYNGMGKLEYYKFKVPSTCICVYKKTFP